MTDERIIPLFPEGKTPEQGFLRFDEAREEEKPEVFDLLFLRQLRTESFWQAGEHAFSCAAYMNLEPLLEETPFLTLECALDHIENLIENMLGAGIHCTAMPLITESGDTRTTELQLLFDGISMQQAKETLGAVKQNNVIPFDA